MLLHQQAPEIQIVKQQVMGAYCTCVKGVVGSYGHVTRLLYQVTKFNVMTLRAVPEDIADISAKKCHQPRREKVAGDEVQLLTVVGYGKHKGVSEKRSQTNNYINIIQFSTSAKLNHLLSSKKGGILRPTSLASSRFLMVNPLSAITLSPDSQRSTKPDKQVMSSLNTTYTET